MKPKIAIGSDHAGFDLKDQIIKALKEDGFIIDDCGTYDNQSCHYPLYAKAVANSIMDKKSEIGILICGTANGVCITANKIKNIRAAIAWTDEIAQLAREHNDANIVCLPARFIDFSQALDIVHAFLRTPFEGGRHKTRVDMIES